MTSSSRSLTQRVILAFVSPATAAAMEADSRAWKLHCPHCAHAVSIWDLGGIRYKAYGNSRMLRRCRNCGRISWQQLRRDAA